MDGSQQQGGEGRQHVHPHVMTPQIRESLVASCESERNYDGSEGGMSYWDDVIRNIRAVPDGAEIDEGGDEELGVLREQEDDRNLPAGAVAAFFAGSLCNYVAMVQAASQQEPES